jgi:outer membrane protein TolC
MKRIAIILLVLNAPVCRGEDGLDRREPMKVSLKRAIEIGTSAEGNAGIQLADEAVKEAQARSAEARATLLPDISGSIGAQNETRSLAAIGLTADGQMARIGLPRSVGPYNLTDARMSASQTLLDLGALRRYQSSKAGVSAERHGRGAAVDHAAGTIARAYVAALRADAGYEAAEANVALANAVLAQAINRNRAGTGTGVEVTRAEVELANEQQRLIASANDQTRTRLELLRAMGRPLDITIELTDRLSMVTVESANVSYSLGFALEQRADWKSQNERDRAAGAAASAAKMDRLPTVSAFTDYGATGTGPDASSPTRTYGVALKLPVFDGGRRGAKVAESRAQLRQEQIRTRDLRDQIELDVRVALDALRSAEKEVSAAEEGLALAEKELAQARKRYEAGMADSLEVTDARTRLARARDNRVQALYRHNLARIAYSEAIGTILQIAA